MKKWRLLADLRRDVVGVSEEQTLIAAAVGNDFNGGVNFGVALNEAANSGAETGGQTACGQECNFLGLAHGVVVRGWFKNVQG